MLSLAQKILDLLGQKQKHSLGRWEISERLNLHGGERKLANKILHQLVQNGQLEERKGRYRGTRQKTVEGVLSLADKGYGFLRLDDEQQEDTFIPQRHIDTAMDGDRVLVSMHVSHRDKRPYGKIVKILQRAHQQLIGHYQQRGKGGEVWPLDRKLGGAVQVGRQEDTPSGTVVEVEIERYASADHPARGRIIEQLGASDDPQVDIETVVRSYNLPHVFSSATRSQAETIPLTIPDDEISRRTDLRDLSLITIDGAAAKDFDDAIYFDEKEHALYVAIADVSSYVEPFGPIDTEAMYRGFTVYFPHKSVPMLPRELSENLCSLRPNEDRLAFTFKIFNSISFSMF